MRIYSGAAFPDFFVGWEFFAFQGGPSYVKKVHYPTILGWNEERLAYENVHRFIHDKIINHKVGEWWPFLTHQGEPIWTHMRHSWKVNYHTAHAMVQSLQDCES